MKGDHVEVIVDTGDGSKRFDIGATMAGRRVEVMPSRGGIIEVSEVTRSGRPVRTGRFMASRVVAVVEHPAGGDEHELRTRGMPLIAHPGDLHGSAR